MQRLRIGRTGRGRPRTRPGRLLADKAYSNRAIRSYLRRRRIKATIPQKSDQQKARLTKGSVGGRPPAFDPEAYKQRNTTERTINRLKAFRAVAMRTDKREFVYNGTIDVASIKIGSATRATKIHETRSLHSSGSRQGRRWSRPPAQVHPRARDTASTTKPAMPNITAAALRSRSTWGPPFRVLNTTDHEAPGPCSGPG